MAKIGLTKLGLKTNADIAILDWNEQSIEIKQYISVQDKLEIIGECLSRSLDDNNFVNPVKLDVELKLQIMYYYTNINFTEKQKEDFLKTYDLLEGSGLLKLIIEKIPEIEINMLKTGTYDCAKAYYDYKNSLVGIMDTISQDYANTDLDATSIQNKLNDPNNLSFLKEIMSKLG